MAKIFRVVRLHNEKESKEESDPIIDYFELNKYFKGEDLSAGVHTEINFRVDEEAFNKFVKDIEISGLSFEEWKSGHASGIIVNYNKKIAKSRKTFKKLNNEDLQRFF